MKNRHSIILLALVVSALSGNPRAMADFGGKFPGKGSNATWQKANWVFDQGNIYFQSKSYDKAIEKYKEAIAIYPDDAEYFNYLGLSYKKKGDMKSAEDSLRQAVALNGSVWSSWSNLASVLKHQGKLQEAKGAYLKSLSLNPPANMRASLQENVTILEMNLGSQSGGAAEEASAAAAKEHAAPSAPPTPQAASTPAPLPAQHSAAVPTVPLPIKAPSSVPVEPMAVPSSAH